MLGVRFVSPQMLPGFALLVILPHRQTPSRYVVCLKLMLRVSYTSLEILRKIIFFSVEHAVGPAPSIERPALSHGVSRGLCPPPRAVPGQSSFWVLCSVLLPPRLSFYPATLSSVLQPYDASTCSQLSHWFFIKILWLILVLCISSYVSESLCPFT